MSAMRSGTRRFGAILCLVLAMPRVAPAHEGPPFPIIVDARVGAYVVSVWTDPDIGIGTFYVVLEAAQGTGFREPENVRVGVRPVSGRLPETMYDGTPERVRRGARFLAEVSFDRGELWDVRIVIDGPAGAGELLSQVEATPDGTLGPIGLLVYSFPFLLLALLWWRAAVARRRMSQEVDAKGNLAAR